RARGRHCASRPRTTSPARSSTLRCSEIEGWVMRNGSATAVTERAPVLSRSRMARRVGSASAPKMAPSGPGAAVPPDRACVAIWLYTHHRPAPSRVSRPGAGVGRARQPLQLAAAGPPAGTTTMATRADVRRIALSLPETLEEPGRFAFAVRGEDKPRPFVWEWRERVHPRKPKVPNPEVIVIPVASLEDKAFLLGLDGEKFFTEPHYDGYAAVLVRLPA